MDEIGLARLRVLTPRARRGSKIKAGMHGAADGAMVLEHACKLKLEGIVSKRADAPYRSSKRPERVKTKYAAWREANRDRFERWRSGGDNERYAGRSKDAGGAGKLACGLLNFWFKFESTTRWWWPVDEHGSRGYPFRLAGSAVSAPDLSAYWLSSPLSACA
jgi:hypothetical protein